jgi:hypothetical protein
MLFLLAGCQEEEQLVVDPSITESLVMEVPQLNHGVLEYEKLKVEPWYCGRMEFTGNGYWAETETGYYHYEPGTSILKYADKADLSKWVPVCSKPNCQHTINVLGCNAHLDGNSFLIRDGRIYFAGKSGGKNEQLYMEEQYPRLIASRALDGTDPRIDYYIPDTNTSSQCIESHLLAQEYWLMNISIFNPDGSYTHRSYYRTKDALEVIAEKTGQENRYYLVGEGMVLDGMRYSGYNGDAIFYNELLSEVLGNPPFTSYRFINGVPERLPHEGYERLGQYLCGNTLRIYRQNDGYYDLDLTTRQETKVANSQLADGFGVVMLPNCIIEFNDQQILIFDGESWLPVQIPEELQGVSLGIGAIASDRILFIRYEYPSTVMHLYQVMLGDDTLTLQYCGKIH